MRNGTHDNTMQQSLRVIGRLSQYCCNINRWKRSDPGGLYDTGDSAGYCIGYIPVKKSIDVAACSYCDVV